MHIYMVLEDAALFLPHTLPQPEQNLFLKLNSSVHTQVHTL